MKTTKKGPEKAIERLVKLTKGDGCDLEKACNSLKLHPNGVRKLVSEAQKRGVLIEIDGDFVGRPPRNDENRSTRIDVSPVSDTIRFAVASDIHIGSKYFLKDYFTDFIHKMHARGVRLILGPGDILDGVYRHSRWEESHHGYQDQANYAVEVMPRLPGLKYVMISGNHDQTFEEATGIDVVQSLPMAFRSAGRTDFEMVGARGAYLRLMPPGSRGRGVVVELWHPGKGTAYALSYKLQKHVEGYAVGQKPDMVFAGHWHQQCYFTTRGVHAFSSGTWHGGMSPFGKMLGGAPSIGGWEIEVKLTKQGTVREVSPTWHAYYEKEQVRTVELG